MGVPSSFLASRKQLVRSVLDPLPRSLSIRSLAILVSMLVGGIAISVHEYLESGRVVRAAAPARASTEAPLQIPGAGESGSAAVCLPPAQTPAPSESVSTCEKPIEDEPSLDGAPGMWTPDARSTGS